MLRQPFPHKEFKIKEVNEMLKELRENIIAKKVTPFDFFNELDKNKDGFLNYNEFYEGLDLYIDLNHD
jgi:Ca2+-binding EF-hand superfamily protein